MLRHAGRNGSDGCKPADARHVAAQFRK